MNFDSTHLKCFVIFLAFFALQAHARTNVLFIDLNNAEDEIDAILEGLPRAERDITIVPPLTRFDDKKRDAILKTTVKYNKLAKEAETCAEQGIRHCQDLWQKLREVELARQRLTGNYALSDLLTDTASLESKPYDVLVISGHHDTGYFRGEIAALEVLDLALLNAERPRLFSQLRTVILLGCGTGTREMLSTTFNQLFPRVQIIIGAEDNAPTRSEARNLRFIREVMRSERQLHKLKGVDDLVGAQRKLMRTGWPVSILWQQKYFVAKEWSGYVGELSSKR